MRHIICHIYPLRSTGTWRRTIAHILARRDLWDGKKLVSVAIDHTTDFPAPEFRQLEDAGFDVSWVRNNPQLGEGASFPALLEQVRNEPGETFYCHGKGSTHPPGHISQQWADVMFHLCLDYQDLMGATLQDYGIAGAFRRIEKRMNVPWHYSGTMFCFNNRPDLKPPQTLDRNCVERWPSENFPVERSGDLGLSDCRSLYDEINWRSWITRRFQKEIQWNADRKAMRVKRQGLPETAFEPLREIYAD